MDENYTTTTTFTGVIYSWINTITDMSYIGSTNNNTTTIFPSMTLANTTLRIPLSSMNRILNLGGGNWKNFKITAA